MNDALGIIGMLAGWWQVTLPSGCPWPLLRFAGQHSFNPVP